MFFYCELVAPLRDEWIQLVIVSDVTLVSVSARLADIAPDITLAVTKVLVTVASICGFYVWLEAEGGIVRLVLSKTAGLLE